MGDHHTNRCRHDNGFNGEIKSGVSVLPVAHLEHPLHQLGREITLRDLRNHRHLFVRDTGSNRDKDAPMFRSEYRWTVFSMPTSIGAACRCNSPSPIAAAPAPTHCAGPKSSGKKQRRTAERKFLSPFAIQARRQ